MNRTTRIGAFGLLLGGILAANCAAATIISDTFTNPDPTTGTGVTGRTPEVDLPGGTYQVAGSISTWGDPQLDSSTGSSAVKMGADIGEVISLGSSGSYVKPSTLQISGDLNVGDTTQTDNFTVRVIGLGFYSANDTSHGSDFFTGLALSRNGTLTLTSTGDAVGYVGTFDTGADHHLSYTVDTTDGSISNVLLDGQAKSFATTSFTGSATTDAGFYVSSSSGGPHGYVDNFTVATTPEPALAGAIVALAGSMLLRRRSKGR